MQTRLNDASTNTIPEHAGWRVWRAVWWCCLLAPAALVHGADPAPPQPKPVPLWRAELAPQTYGHGLDMVYTVFGKESLYPLVFAGKMAPRGQICLGGVPPASDPRVLRSPDTDVTKLPLITVAGAHHWDAAEKVTWVEAKDLPPVQLRHHPLAPERVTLPAADPLAAVVVMFQLGEPGGYKWAEGHWCVSLRIDLSVVNVQLGSVGVGLMRDPADRTGTRAIFKVNFISQELRTPTDLANYRYFLFRQGKDDPDPARQREAYLALEAVLAEYPRDGRLLKDYMNVLTTQRRYNAAASVAECLIRWTEARQMTRPYVYPYEDATPEETLNYLKELPERYRLLASRAAEAPPAPKQDATTPEAPKQDPAAPPAAR